MTTRWPLIVLIGLPLAVIGGVGGLLLRMVWPAPILPTTFGVGPNALIAIAVLGIVWSTVGALLAMRRRENPVGSLMILVGCGLALSVLTVAVAFAALAEGTAAGRQVASVAGALTSLLSPILVFVFYLPFIFPTGRGHTVRWDTVGRIFLGIAMVGSALLVLQPGDVHLLPGIPNPVGFGPDLRPIFGERIVGGVDAVGIAILSPFLVLAVASRYRQAGSIERRQLKWYILATAVTVGAALLMFVAAVLTPGPIGELPMTVFALAGLTVPVAIGVAILRYRLYEIDRIVSRTIAYGLVSAILAAVFGGVIVSLSAALSSFAQGETIAVAVSTLAAFAAFQPVLRRVRREVDRRFDRAGYDAERTIAKFSDRLRDEIDLAHLSSDLESTIREAIAPRSLGIWIRRSPPTSP
jgi:hypothetical protein